MAITRYNNTSYWHTMHPDRLLGAVAGFSLLLTIDVKPDCWGHCLQNTDLLEFYSRAYSRTTRLGSALKLFFSNHRCSNPKFLSHYLAVVCFKPEILNTCLRFEKLIKWQPRTAGGVETANGAGMRWQPRCFDRQPRYARRQHESSRFHDVLLLNGTCLYTVPNL